VPAVPPIYSVADLPPEPHRHREYGDSSPLVPPWKMPMDSVECQGPTIIKSPPPPPDVISKGTLLDFFM
jgi:hypothetical protein